MLLEIAVAIMQWNAQCIQFITHNPEIHLTYSNTIEHHLYCCSSSQIHRLKLQHGTKVHA